MLGRDDLPFTIGLNHCEEADGTTFDEMRIVWTAFRFSSWAAIIWRLGSRRCETMASCSRRSSTLHLATCLASATQTTFVWNSSARLPRADSGITLDCHFCAAACCNRDDLELPIPPLASGIAAGVLVDTDKVRHAGHVERASHDCGGFLTLPGSLREQPGPEG